MKQSFTQFFLIIFFLCFLNVYAVHSQVLIRGNVKDANNGEALIGAAISSDAQGTITDYEGNFSLKVTSLPVTLKIAYTGYTTKELEVRSADSPLNILLEPGQFIIEETEIIGQRIDERQKAAPLTVENLDAISIRETPSVSFYNGLGNLKGVDLTTASLGFTVINTRGFNSTSPVRSLQIIDGVDNQAPGLNFSLGNFLGASELDVQNVDLVVGASSAFYGPNAFNGVISMSTKNPFYHRGLSASVKTGERDLFEGAIRWADAWKNKNGHAWMAAKLNFYHLRAYDWEADNYDAVYESFSPAGNPGGYDKVNVYGDEYFSGADYSDYNPRSDFPGLGAFHRTGYRELDLVDYNTRNYKANAFLHFRLNPAKDVESPELILGSAFGSGTTVYQGDNRFSLRNILYFQHKLELRHGERYFIRLYATSDDAGDSYDPYFTALKLQEQAKSDVDFAKDYADYFATQRQKAKELGYPQPFIDFSQNPPRLVYDVNDAYEWEAANSDIVASWHDAARAKANRPNSLITAYQTYDFFVPGTEEFNRRFNDIRSRLSNSKEGGTRFYDKSALYHAQGQYRFTPGWFKSITVGASTRVYLPKSQGTIFYDSIARISSMELGAYAGAEKEFADGRLRTAVTVRLDKRLEDLYNEMPFLTGEARESKILVTPAASVVYTPEKDSYLRISFSSAIRNPTLTDKYLSINVGRAILSGNLTGVTNLVTLDSYRRYIESFIPNPDTLKRINIAGVRPERVNTLEAGYRTTLWNRLYVDASYYYSIYSHFLGYNIGLDVQFADNNPQFPSKIQAYRFAANSTNQVTTQGLSIGLNYYFEQYYQLSANYSWNRLNSQVDDPIIPAFNTPEHKFNIGISGRDITIRLGRKRIKNIGFNVNYKWIEGFLFEGSPQFTGFIPTYDMLDAQVNWRWQRPGITFKLGASNILDNQRFQVYGGPRVGRMAYASILYEFKKN